MNIVRVIIPTIAGALAVVGFVLATTVDPDAINMGIGSLIATVLLTVLSIATWETRNEQQR